MLPFSPTVSSITIVLLLLTGIRQNKKCIWNRFFLSPQSSIRETSPVFFSICPNPNLTMQWLLNITYCLVVFESCCELPVLVGVGLVFGLVPGEQRGKICKHQMLSLLLLLSFSLLLLHSSTFNIPAVCLSALFQWWCETWRQGAWAASSCQLTL